METAMFDTLAYVRLLRSGGFTQEQAETLAEAQKLAVQDAISARELDLRDVATKRDLANLRAELFKWLVKTGITITGIMVACFLGMGAWIWRLLDGLR